MKTLEIIGYKRANLGKTEAKALRNEAKVPCVLYGGGEQVHFSADAYFFRDLIYTPNAYFVTLNIEGQEYKAILQDSQYHPVSDNLLHADFLLLQDGKETKMDIPVELTGNAPGVSVGGKLVLKTRKLRVQATPENMPESIKVDVSHLELGKTVKVESLSPENYEILNNTSTSIASITIPRALRSKMNEEA
ncbi:50S ribosomal protein L25/general stress protein Ctc [Aureibacter tunicatorum]|uniref:Large ribosomal subunit protein bL25 n=1 Tax=Aureibacter tunicatorum TaxID=866807 RepID=A0AAE4BRW1_9BACT|nr:50S ribosomal protein L25/general stress protein Ctc [Aureibacter tunicatorum]MDR6238288.1 large subunit ribosomal protein L25 [Aureibacter tunicatorum]BDD03321.1 50S ribosomal protein L25 [Aureibacter tunicatorum]